MVNFSQIKLSRGDSLTIVLADGDGYKVPNKSWIYLNAIIHIMVATMAPQTNPDKEEAINWPNLTLYSLFSSEIKSRVNLVISFILISLIDLYFILSKNILIDNLIGYSVFSFPMLSSIHFHPRPKNYLLL